MSKPLDSVLNADALLALAGATIYQRGVGYQRSGMVLDLVVVNDKVQGQVAGSDVYEVQLWQQRGRLQYQCSCPMGEDGDCCKHVVALGLAWLHQTPAARKRAGQKADQARAFLEAQEKCTLVDWLLEQVTVDPALHATLQARAQKSGAAADRSAVLRAISNVLGGTRMVPWNEVPRLVREADTVTELLGSLLNTKQYALAAEAADHALVSGIRRYQHCDDSGGSFGSFLTELAGLHLQAYRKAAQEYPLTATQLLKLLKLDEWSLLAFGDYASLLADKEYQRYRKLVLKDWQRLPQQRPERDGMRSWHYFPEASRMEDIARYENDVDLLVTVISRDLGSPYRFLLVAEVLQAARRLDEAVSWAERGLQSFGNDYDGRLVAFLVKAYCRRKRTQEAAALQERYFRASPSLDAWKQLGKLVKPAKVWASLRLELLGLLEQGAQARQRKTGVDRYRGDCGVLIEILLWEKDASEALRVANSYGAVDHLWLDIASVCEQQLPREAVGIYQRHTLAAVERRNNAGYDSAKVMVDKVRSLMQKLGEGSAFNTWLRQLKVEHKAKRNFIARLEKVAELAEDRRR